MKRRSQFDANDRFAGGRCRPVQAESVQAAGCEADASLDFVFIDADPHYHSVMADLRAWWRKLKPGGILAGHDYLDSSWPGVTAAVHDWAFDNGIKVHDAPPHAFWVKKSDGWRATRKRARSFLPTAPPAPDGRRKASVESAGAVLASLACRQASLNSEAICSANISPPRIRLPNWLSFNCPLRIARTRLSTLSFLVGTCSSSHGSNKGATP